MLAVNIKQKIKNSKIFSFVKNLRCLIGNRLDTNIRIDQFQFIRPDMKKSYFLCNKIVNVEPVQCKRRRLHLCHTRRHIAVGTHLAARPVSPRALQNTTPTLQAQVAPPVKILHRAQRLDQQRNVINFDQNCNKIIHFY